MDEEIEKIVEEVVYGDAYFIPSHLTRGLFGTAVAVVAGGVSIGAALYAAWEFKQVRVDEIQAMIKGVE